MSKRRSSTNISCFSKISCFTTSNSKPVRTCVHRGNIENEFGNHQTNKTEGALGKLKVSAQKIYDNLKKMKQTISPSGQFTNFISGIFTSGDPNDPKKIRESYLNEGCADVVNADVKSKYKRTSTCPSASSLARSCLSKSSPKSRHKRDTRMKKRVRSCHVDVEVDENCHKTNSRQPKLPHVDHNKNDVTTNSRQPKLPHVDHKRNDVMTNSKELKLPHGDHGRNGVMKSCEDSKNYEFMIDFLRMRMKIFEDDCSIDWSSDLAEIERLSSFII